MKAHPLASILIAAALFVLAAPAHAQETVVVANRVIYPGETVTIDQLDDVPLRRQLRNPAVIVHENDQLVGKVARRTILPGRLIPTNSVREAFLVETGRAVEVVLEHGPMQISIAGISLQDGTAGDLIRVRNADSGAVFNGVVMDDGTIKVPTS